MAKHAKPGEAKAASQPEAESVDREPTGEPTPQEHGLPVDQEDAPKGQPTSDRFHTEQAHKAGRKDAKAS
jgi:hypothetical protein